MSSRIMTIILLVLLVCTGPVFQTAHAQESDYPYSLRDLADLNNIYIGAAAWSNHLYTQEHADLMGSTFNSFTPEHEAKWCMISAGGPGLYDFDKVDELVDYAEAHDMVIHGHALVWHSCSPDWVESATWTRDEAIQVLHEHINTVVSRYKGRIKYWDVVNEAFDGPNYRDTAWLRLIGEDYIELAFQFAHEADPDAILLYNDYGGEQMNSKSDAINRMAKDFVARGVPINGIGFQSHFDLGNINFGSIADNMQRLGELGLEVQFTEVDIKYLGETTDEILRLQAVDYYHLMETCLDADNCTAFIVWGVTDKYSWLRQKMDFFDNSTVEPLLFDTEYQPKPAYYALMDLLARRAGVPSILSDEEITAILEGPQAAAAADIPEPTRSDPAQLAPDPVAGLIYYAPIGTTITLDGDLSDWENIPRVTVDKGPLLPAGNDTSFEFAAAADDTNLYYMANVTDSNVVYGNYDTSSWYEEDSIEFYLNTTGDLKATSYKPGIVQVGIMAANLDNPETPMVGGSNSADAQVNFVVVKTETGYVVEAAVPLQTAVWDIVPEHEGVLGFQAHLNGASADARDTKLIWSAADIQDQSYSNPSLFGQLIFWDPAK